MLKKASILIKLGCLMCIVTLIIFYIFGIFNNNLIINLIIKCIDYIETKYYNYCYDNYNNIDNLINNISIINAIFTYYFYILTIIFLIFVNWYMKVLKGQANNLSRILAGLLGLFFGIIPGLFILLGKYEDNFDFYISHNWRYR